MIDFGLNNRGLLEVLSVYLRKNRASCGLSYYEEAQTANLNLDCKDVHGKELRVRFSFKLMGEYLLLTLKESNNGTYKEETISKHDIDTFSILSESVHNFITDALVTNNLTLFTETTAVSAIKPGILLKDFLTKRGTPETLTVYFNGYPSKRTCRIRLDDEKIKIVTKVAYRGRQDAPTPFFTIKAEIKTLSTLFPTETETYSATMVRGFKQAVRALTETMPPNQAPNQEPNQAPNQAPNQELLQTT